MGHIGHIGTRQVTASGIRILAALLVVMSKGAVLALNEVPYGVAKEPWEEGMGNHRAIVRVEQKAGAVVVKIPWRRRDRDPERKQIIVVDSATSQRVTNVARLHLDRFEGVVAFQPQTVPGDYFVYYLPFVPKPGWGRRLEGRVADGHGKTAARRSRAPGSPDGVR